MNSALKEKILQEAKSAGEEHIMLSVDQVYKMAKIYVEDTSNPFDNQILKFLESLKDNLKETVDKLDGEDDFQAS